MKKLFIIAVVLITGITANKVSAQTTLSATGALPATLTLTLNPALSITVMTPDVGLNFETSADYLDGVKTTQSDHLTFASTSGFSITAKADGNLKGGTGGEIPINTVTITPTDGTKKAGGTVTSQRLLATPVTIYTSGSKTTGGTTEASLDMDYKASGGTDYLNRTGTFTSTITYTITAL